MNLSHMTEVISISIYILAVAGPVLIKSAVPLVLNVTPVVGNSIFIGMTVLTLASAYYGGDEYHGLAEPGRDYTSPEWNPPLDCPPGREDFWVQDLPPELVQPYHGWERYQEAQIQLEEQTAERAARIAKFLSMDADTTQTVTPSPDIGETDTGETDTGETDTGEMNTGEICTGNAGKKPN
jgi:hypothetical protein